MKRVTLFDRIVRKSFVRLEKMIKSNRSWDADGLGLLSTLNWLALLSQGSPQKLQKYFSAYRRTPPNISASYFVVN